ncbi:hypothetical protein [Winogradskyella haliclonae]|uniref:Uncharacterized protein n=1 Tax=Winogradskyella haliclonae TaxID=2048558 RepID=A0ABQ2BV70_9FLAO|nr:hypothetical protein [Winogradskyella haliclonae]GGI55715.1 hypothetical protein GCM10011444_00240 [Winogradskyella haliclonae]
MNQKNLNIAFFVTTGISVLVFIYLVFLGYDEIKTFKDVIKIIASILFPIPILFFVRLIVIENFMPENTEAYKVENQKPATLFLAITVIVVIIILQILELVTLKKLEDTLILAHLINSTTISSYVFNFLLYNNLKANGVLSGVLMALAIHIFFLSA